MTKATHLPAAPPTIPPEGFRHLPGLLGRAEQACLLKEIAAATALAPLYRPTMPKTGRPMSVLMTNCGDLGWLTSKTLGYRYQATHPETGNRWPPIPEAILAVWRTVAEIDAAPEACLINWYEPASKLGLHVDRDEQDLAAPVVSISLGDDAWFRIGGLTRRAPTTRVLLRSGDVVVLAGKARLAYHGIDRIVPGTGDLLPVPGRYNLTLRRVTPC